MDFETVRNYLHKPSQPDETKRQTHAVGVAMSTIKASTEWKVYADHLQALIEAAEAKARRIQGEILNGACVGSTEYYEQKRQYSIAKATSAAYTMSIHMVDMLIERGEDAAQDLAASLQTIGQ